MLPNITAGDMMQSNLITLSPEMELLDAIDLLLRHRASGAPVVDRDDQFVGIFSEQSCMRLIVHSAVERLHVHNLPLMTFVDAHAPVVNLQTDLLSIAQTFVDIACRRLPVLDEAGRLCGQVSRRDLLRVIREHIRSLDAIPAGAAVYLTAIFDAGPGFL
jgi:predicted transcriptional regulator